MVIYEVRMLLKMDARCFSSEKIARLQTPSLQIHLCYDISAGEKGAEYNCWTCNWAVIMPEAFLEGLG
jgi:hypothetical protein